MSSLKRLINWVATVGILSTDSFALKRRKEFFNIVTTVGGLASIPQAISGFYVDFYAGTCHLIWGVACIISISIHHYVNFKTARFATFVSVFALAGFASARMGHESYQHLSSLTLFLGIFILHDLRKEWGWIVFYFLLEVIAILVIESNIWKAPNAPEISTYALRAGTFIGTISFLALEFIYFIRIGLSNELHVNQQLRSTNSILNQRNAEKDLLIKEIHHRVKNNLQIISSLLRLQSYEINDSDAKEKFIDSVNRIKSISNLHETIYQSDNILKIDLNTYLQNLALSLIESYSIEKNIELDIQSDLINVDNDQIVPISLILNEMISNSVKHAFKNKATGKISISISKLAAENQYQILYSDSGSWIESTKSNSFGIELIQSLVDQLNGTIERRPNVQKSEYSIRFEAIESNRI